MQSINNILDNREIAIFFWMGVLFIWAIFNKKIRQSIIGVLKALTKKAVAISSLLMILYIGLMIYLSQKIDLWRPSNLGETILWIFGVAFVMFVNVNHASEDNYFRNIVVDNLKFVVILEFITNVYVFNLWIELILVPIMAFIGAIWGYSSFDLKNKKVHSFFTAIVGIIGFFFLIYAVYNIIIDFQGFASINNLREFMIPLIFTVAFLPFIYVLALYLLYDLIFTRIRYIIKDQKLARYARMKTIFAFHVNLKWLRMWIRKIALQKLENKDDINRAIKDVKSKGMENMDEETKPDTENSESPNSKIFIQFYYPEIKDLSKSFLTLISGILAFSVTFSTSIIGFPATSSTQLIFLISAWLSFVIAIITTGGYQKYELCG